MNRDIIAICQAYQIGFPKQAAERVSGGRLHQLWRVATDQGDFVIKQLQKDFFHAVGGVAHYEQTEKIARDLAKKHIPAAAALLHNNSPLFSFNKDFYLVFQWLNGKHITADKISLEQLGVLAKVLKNIHSQNLNFNQLVKFPDIFFFNQAQWLSLIAKIKEIDLELALLLEQALPKIKEAVCRGEQAYKILQPLKQVISHRDLDSQNVIWSSKGPFVIDWEYAGCIHPVQDLISVALAWSIVDAREIKWKNIAMLVQAYDLGEISSDIVENALWALFNSWLEWLYYNLQRYINHKDVEIKLLAEKEVNKTLCSLELVLRDFNRIINCFLYMPNPVKS